MLLEVQIGVTGEFQVAEVQYTTTFLKVSLTVLGKSNEQEEQAIAIF